MLFAFIIKVDFLTKYIFFDLYHKFKLIFNVETITAPINN